MKAQKNLETLYYNAAMKTGQASLQASSQAAALREKARQYDWQAQQTLISGALSFGVSMLDGYAKSNKGTTDVKPYASLKGDDASVHTAIQDSLFGGSVSDYGLRMPSLG
jgi:hypothetical protein